MCQSLEREGMTQIGLSGYRIQGPKSEDDDTHQMSEKSYEVVLKIRHYRENHRGLQTAILYNQLFFLIILYRLKYRYEFCLINM